MNIVEDAKKELESGIVAYMEFALEYKNTTSIVYCFYEGYEDRNFYSLRVKSYFPEFEYFDFVCKGRDNVMKVYNLIKSHPEYKSSVIGYFLDQDYEPVVENPEIFTIPCYSIENLFAYNDTVETILLNEFNISKRDNDFAKCMNLFESLRQKFLEECNIFNAWLACQSDLRIEKQQKTRLNIDEIVKGLFDKIVNNDLLNIEFSDGLKSQDNIEQLFSQAEKISSDKLNAKIDLFNTYEKIYVIRGKFLLKFLISFLRKLQDEIGKKDSSLFEKKHSCNLRFEFATAISQLGNNVKNPQELHPYLKSIKKNVA